MNFRHTAIILGIVLLLVVGLLVSSLMDDTPVTDGLLMPALDGLKPADIDLVEIFKAEPTEEKMVFARTGKDRWELREPSPGRADALTLTRVIGELLKLKPTLSKDLTGNAAAHGLDKPGLKVTLRSSTNKSATLFIGDSIGGENPVTFVAMPDRAGTPIAVKRGDLTAVFRDNAKDGKSAVNAKGVSDYRLKRLFGVDMGNAVDTAKELKIKAAGKEMVLRHPGNDWTFDTPANYGVVDLQGDPVANPGVITGLRTLIGLVNGYAATGPDDFIENPESLQMYGLAANDPNLIRIELTPKDGPPDVLLIGKKIDGPGVNKYYAMVPGERCVVKIAADRLEALVKTVADPKPLQDRTLVRDSDAGRIDAMTITAGGTTANLRKVPMGSLFRWVLYGGPNDPQFAGAIVQTLIQELSVPRVATDVVAPPNDAAFAAAEIKSEVKIWFDSFEPTPAAKAEEFPTEPKPKGIPAVILQFGKVDAESLYVRRILADGTKTDFKVPATLATKVAKKRSDYLDLKFKEFPTNIAKKLTFNRGTEVFEIVRSDAPEADFPLGKWTFVKPESLKGQIADVDKVGGGTSLGAGLIGTLATLSASSAVTEAPTDAELKVWGLEPTAPRLKAAVELDDKTIRSYDFGNETPDKAYVFFRMPGKPTVYQVPRVAVDAFFIADVRDRTPYRIDVSKVKSIRVRWWKNKAVTEATFEKGEKDWTVKATPPYKVDTKALLNLLNHLRSPKPLAVIGPVKTEHGFGAGDADPMEVAFFDAEGKQLANVTLGNETDGGASYFFWNAATNEVSKLPSALFKPVKDSVESLKAK
ncbi:hypothetical protein BH11PLA2_BH11PLA2_04410 [soil metagenome]